jgi:Zn-dependent protease with chaperone function
MKYTARLPKTNVNVTPTSPLREFFILTGGLFGLVVFIYLILGLAVDLIVPHISPDLEKKMAVHIVGSFDTSDDTSDKAAYIQSLIETMQNHCTELPYQFTIHVRKAPVANALAMPGGHIIIFTELLDTVTSENELAFILAHEMGHYANRDHLRGVGRAFVFMTMSAFLFGPDSSVSKMLAHSLNLSELSFSRKQEYQADEFGLKTLNCAYGHASGATDFFEKIPKERDPGKFGHYFASHPENRRRISRINNIIQTKKFKLAERKPLPEVIRKSKTGNNKNLSPNQF